MMLGRFLMGAPGLLGRAANYKKLQDLMMLWLVSETSPDGITGYEIQDSFNTPQTTAYRLLNRLATKELAIVDETKVDGRIQKRYKITSKGRKRLEELKQHAMGRISVLFDVISDAESGSLLHIPFTGINTRLNILKHQLDVADSKEKALNVLRDLIKHMEGQERLLQEIKENIGAHRERVKALIEKIENSEIYSRKYVIDQIAGFVKNQVMHYLKEDENNE